MKKNKQILLLMLLVILGGLIRFLWLETTVERDEGIFGYIGWRMNHGEKLYFDLKENKPPLVFYSYAFIISLFGNSILPVRILNNVLFLISVFILYKALVIRWKKSALFGIFVYIIFMNLPVFEGPLAMSESLANFFMVCSYFLFERFIEKDKAILLIGSFFFSLIASLYAVYSIFLAFYFFYFLYVNKRKEIYALVNHNRRKTVAAVILFAVPAVLLMKDIMNIAIVLAPTFNFYFYSRLKEYIPASYWELILFEGAFIWYTLIYGAYSLIKSRKQGYKSDFILLGLLLASVLVPPSFGHYWLRLSLAASLFSGYGLYMLTKNKNVLLSSLLIISLLVTLFFASLHYPDFNIKFKGLEWNYGGEYSSREMQLEISGYLENVTGPEDKVGIWGWDGTAHFLSKRQFPDDYYILWICYDDLLTTEEALSHASRRVITDREDMERYLTQNDSGEIRAFIIFNQYKRKCLDFDKPIFADYFNGWNQKSFGQITVYSR